VASRYYGEALTLLIRALRDPNVPGDPLTAALLLGSYEVLAAQANEHERHGEGAAKLIRLRGITASSLGLDRANFWIYVRHELSIAFSSESPLRLDPSRWEVTWPGHSASEYCMANYLMWLAARAVDIMYTVTSDDASRRAELMRDLENWHNATPSLFRGIMYGPPNDLGLRKVFFAQPTAGKSFFAVEISGTCRPLESMPNAGELCCLTTMTSGSDAMVPSCVYHTIR
jgi:hypothetical protein